MHRKSVAMALFMAALFLIVASQASASTAGDGYVPVDYRLYPAPEGGYVGDTMPFVTEDGTLELYYLYDTDHNGQGYHPIYKYTTEDLCGYEDDGMVLDYGLMSDPDPALGTGSVMQDREGLYHLFYTGHNDPRNGGMGKECVMHATSADRVHWEKHPEDTFFSPEGYSRDDFRDPEVFWVEEEQCYWLLIAAREDALGGVIAKYTSPDLKTWTFEGPLYAPQAQYMLECPDLFRMSDTWYLTYSWDCVTYYAIGESMNGPFLRGQDCGVGRQHLPVRLARSGRALRGFRHLPVGGQRAQPSAGPARGQDAGRGGSGGFCGLLHAGFGLCGVEY